MAVMLPRKREKTRSGIERAPKRTWLRHERWVRSHNCSVSDCLNGPIEFAHIRTAANAGTGLKPASWSGVSLCADHHAESHRGERTFERKYAINLAEIAAEFARKSPDLEMRLAMKEAGL